MWEYVDGKASSWNLEMEFKYWKKMKTLYLDSEDDEEEESVPSTSSESPKEGTVVEAS